MPAGSARRHRVEAEGLALPLGPFAGLAQDEELGAMLPDTYAYRRCKDNNWDIIVSWDGFDAQETSCNLNKIERQGAAWLATFSCSGAGLSWLEDDEIRVSKNGWTLEAKIKNVRRVGDPIRYCLANKC
jgi:hypothetical protein